MRKKVLSVVILIALIVSFSTIYAEGEWYQETLYDGWEQRLRMSEKIFEEHTSCQDLVIFQNPLFGRVLALDGVIQTTEADEFVYHEMMTHVPILSHGHVQRVLVIGGGDGGIIREVMRHQGIAHVVLVEIDSSVIEMSKKYFPKHSKGAFEDSRLKVVIEDGSLFVKNTTEKFDLIICDSTDPIGPGKVLFTSEFYGDCHRILRDGGIFVNQNGVPFVQGETIAMTHQNRSPHFKNVTFYLATIPTYVGGSMAFGWASDDDRLLHISIEELEKRLQAVPGKMRYYTPAVHKASFALPKYVEELIP